VHFGKWIFLSSLVTFLAARLDVLMLGRLVPTTLLGVYSIAGVLAALPQEVTGRLISFVLFPAMAESARQGSGTLHENLRRARQALLPGVLTVVLGIALFAPAFFYYLYDARYHAAGWMAQLLMFKLWFYTLHEITAHTLLALGNSRALALGNVARLFATAVGCIVGYQLGGLPGLVLGAGAGGAAGYVTVALAAQRHGLSVWSSDLRYTGIGLAFGLIGGLGPHLIAAAFSRVGVPLLGVVLGTLILAPVAWVATRRVRASFNPDPAPAG
jgi:O-antigen/teichoic acid export membrane protein